MVKANPPLVTKNNSAINSITPHTASSTPLYIHPLKDYSLKSIKSFIVQNIEILIFITLAICLVVYFAYRAKEHFENTANINKPQGINELDAIIYINLENRADRKDLFLKELEKLQTDMTKVHKVTGVFIPKNGHKGCIQAHILALELAKLNGWNRTLIFEDDVELNVSPTDFNTTINTVLAKLENTKTPWDVIMLGTANKVYKESSPSLDITIQSQPSNLPSPSENSQINPSPSNSPIEKTLKLKKLKSATTSSAYIVQQPYVNKILKLFKKCNSKMSPDKLNQPNYETYALDQQWAKLQNVDNWFALDEDPVKQRAIWSTIMKETHNT